MTIVDIQHAWVCRGERQVLTDLSLQISAGVHMAILGPNGAGKSTLLKLLSLESHPMPREETVVRLFDRERWNVWELRRHLGVISHELQHRYLDGAHGIHVILSGYFASVDTYQHQNFGYGELTRATEIMEDLGIVHLQDRPFGEMSTGEQRRFLLGRALVHDPQLIVLDEPFASLDVRSREWLERLFDMWRRARRTVCFASHDVRQSGVLADRIAWLGRGRIEAIQTSHGTPTALVQTA